ncbi:MAG: hypothetical protein ACFFB7_09155 [Candidatus Sifarchaeia archaeon]
MDGLNASLDNLSDGQLVEGCDEELTLVLYIIFEGLENASDGLLGVRDDGAQDGVVGGGLQIGGRHFVK